MEELNEDYIIPGAFDERVATALSEIQSIFEYERSLSSKGRLLFNNDTESYLSGKA